MLLALPLIGNSQLSKTHYIPPLTSGLSNAIPDDQYLYLSSPSAADIGYTIKPIGELTVKVPVLGAPSKPTHCVRNKSPTLKTSRLPA